MSNSRKLPPSERDFDIYEAVHVAGYPTREQATKYGISQTRVRQIVRRVIEWLGEVIPPQAKVAKEQQSHLARQIAADRFNLQYTEAATNWYQSGELKFAGLRIRITHAQARLGVPGSLIGGLAADAIEGLDVPAYVPPPEPVGWAVPTSAGRASPDPAHDPPEGLPDEADSDPPVIYCDPICWNELTPEIIAAREAAGMPIPRSLIQYAIDHGALPRPDTADEDRTAVVAFATPHSALRNPHFPSPPPGDCSASTDESTSRETDATEHSIATNDAATTCNDGLADPNDHAQRAETRSQPLLTDQSSLPVTELQLTPNQPGAAVTSAKESTLMPLSHAQPP